MRRCDLNYTFLPPPSIDYSVASRSKKRECVIILNNFISRQHLENNEH